MPTVLELELIRLRQMTATQKLAVSEGLWREAWSLKRASLVTQHSTWTSAQIDEATRKAMTGERV